MGHFSKKDSSKASSLAFCMHTALVYW